MNTDGLRFEEAQVDSGVAPFELLIFAVSVCRDRNRDLYHGLLGVALVQSRARIRHAGPGQGGRLELISYQTGRPRELRHLPARGLSFEELQPLGSTNTIVAEGFPALWT